MHATFKQLEAFEAAARCGSLARAAEELHLTQPTLSMQIKKLSDAVGAPLFDHVGRGLRLTEEGQDLLVMCRDVFGALARFDMALAERRGLKRGVLRLAAVTTAKYFIPRFLGDFCRRYPSIEVTLEVAGRPQILARLHEGLDDLYVFSQIPDDVAVEAFPFLDNTLAPVAPADHPLAHAKAIPLERLAAEPFILREPGSGTRVAVDRVFAEHGLTIRPRMQLGSNEAIKQAVIGGLGISVLSHMALGHDADPRLVVLDAVSFPLRHRWYLVYPTGRRLSTVARAFIDGLIQSPADQPAPCQPAPCQPAPCQPAP